MLKKIKESFMFQTLYSKWPRVLRPGYLSDQKMRNEIKKTEYLSRDELTAYQFKKLNRLLHYAWDECQGYKKLWKEHGFKPAHFKTLKDLQHVPFLTKDYLRDHLEALISSKYKNKKKEYITTGGSTGLPVGIYRLRSQAYQERAFINDGVSFVNSSIQINSPKVILRAEVIEEGKKWLYNPHIGLVLSSFDLTKENAYLFARLIRHYNLKTIHTFPSNFYLFSKLLEDAGEDTKGLFDFIWLSSEMLLPNQRIYLEKFYGKNIYIHYGQSEQVVYASPCRGSKNYHIYPQYGFTEILDENNKEVALNGSGQIIGTSFLNWITPLIRYKTGDSAIKGKSFCKFCNRAYLTMKEIQGREQDFIVDKENTRIPVSNLNMHDDIFDHLLEFQFEQKEAGEIIFNYIPRKGTLNKAEADELVKRLKEKLRNFDILLNQVERFDFTVSGKKKMILQHLSL